MPSFFIQRALVPDATQWIDLGTFSAAAGTPTAEEIGSNFGVGHYRFWIPSLTVGILMSSVVTETTSFDEVLD